MAHLNAQEEAIGVIARILESKGACVPSLDGDTVLLGGDLPIDSLDVALVISELEERTGKDPFVAGFVPFQTIGQLADLYQHP